MDKFDPNPIFVHVNKLVPHRFLENEVKSLGCPTLVYWENRGDIFVDDEKVDNDEEVVPIVNI
jgi:hypothetical protein